MDHTTRVDWQGGGEIYQGSLIGKICFSVRREEVPHESEVFSKKAYRKGRALFCRTVELGAVEPDLDLKP